MWGRLARARAVDSSATLSHTLLQFARRLSPVCVLPQFVRSWTLPSSSSVVGELESGFFGALGVGVVKGKTCS